MTSAILDATDDMMPLLLRLRGLAFLVKCAAWTGASGLEWDTKKIDAVGNLIEDCADRAEAIHEALEAALANQRHGAHAKGGTDVPAAD
jgi:hypothetical protein